MTAQCKHILKQTIVRVPCVLNTHMHMLQLNINIIISHHHLPKSSMETRFSGKDVDQLFPACRPVVFALLQLLLHVEQLP